MTREIRQVHVLTNGTPGTVTAAGTAQRLVAIGANGERTVCASLLVYAEAQNAGNLYFGDEDVDDTVGIPVAPGYSKEWTSPDGGVIDLTRIYVDADTDGDGFRFEYLF